MNQTLTARYTPFLEQVLTPSRLQHSLGVMQVMQELTPIYALDPEKARPVFRQMRELKERCEQLLGAPLPHLSMGMTGDFDVAVEEGATMVRIGTALFGERLSSVRKVED